MCNPTDEIQFKCFSLDRVLEVEPDFESDHDHDHDDDITSVSFVSDTPLDFENSKIGLENFGKQKDKIF